MAAPGQPEQLRALAAADVQDPPPRPVRDLLGQLPRYQFLPDDLAQRPQARAPLLLAGGERRAQTAPSAVPRLDRAYFPLSFVQTLPSNGPTAAQVGWNPAVSGPSALITSCRAFES